MILIIKGESEYFADILNKNPNTDFGLYLKPLKNGVVAGSIADAHTYEVVFQDTKYSYLPEDSNQIDFQSYCNPLVILHITNEFFPHLLKERGEYGLKTISWLNKTYAEIDTEPCSIFVPAFYIQSNWYRDDEFLLSKYFPAVTVKKVTKNLFSLNIQADSVFDAMNYLNLVALFTHITNEYGMYTFITDDFAAKYTRVLTNLKDVPYFVFYLFIKRAIKSPQQFLPLKPMLEQYFVEKGMDVDFTYWDTHEERKQFILSKISLDYPIIDIGCGELQYYKRLMNKGFKLPYYAIDEEAGFAQVASEMNRKFGLDNLQFFQFVDDCKVTNVCTILMSEVLEHNSPEHAAVMVKRAMEFNFHQIVITTPNRDFNQFYFDTEGFRHDDHDFEFSANEFEQFIKNTCGTVASYELFYIGDKINGIQPTQCCIIYNKKQL